MRWNRRHIGVIQRSSLCVYCLFTVVSLIWCCLSHIPHIMSNRYLKQSKGESSTQYRLCSSLQTLFACRWHAQLMYDLIGSGARRVGTRGGWLSALWVSSNARATLPEGSLWWKESLHQHSPRCWSCCCRGCQARESNPGLQCRSVMLYHFSTERCWTQMWGSTKVTKIVLPKNKVLRRAKNTLSRRLLLHTSNGKNYNGTQGNKRLTKRTE